MKGARVKLGSKAEGATVRTIYSRRLAQSAGPDVQVCSSVSESPTNSLSGALVESFVALWGSFVR